MRLLLLAACLIMVACGPRGDPDGLPTTFVVELERSFANTMDNRQGRVSGGVAVGIGSHGHRHSGFGLGLHFAATEVHLLGIDPEWGDLLFRHEVHWGESVFQIPLRPGRELILEAVVSGGRAGIERLGERLSVDPQRPIHLQLDERGFRHLGAEAPADPPAPDQEP